MSSMIHAFGNHWNPNSVDWGRRGQGQKGRLEGRVQIKKRWHTIDFWEAKGVYVLHKDFEPVYVGKAFSQGLGKRIRKHLVDRLAGRWDTFSWYSVSSITKGSNSVREPGKRSFGAKKVVATLEALAIAVSDAPLNRRRETQPAAMEAEQAKSPYPQTTQAILETISEKLDSALEELGGLTGA